MDKLPFKYNLNRKVVKNINCTVKNGVVNVSANKDVSIEKIESFLFQKQSLILNALKKQKNNCVQIENNKTINLLQKEYTIKIISSFDNFIKLDNSFIYIHVQDINNNELINSLFDKMILEMSKDIIFPICNKTINLLHQYSLSTPTIKYKKMKSMWGNCYPSKNTITFSTNLLFTNLEFIEYVVLHEFTHLIVPNHQKDFYDIIKKFMPNYKLIKRSIHENL